MRVPLYAVQLPVGKVSILARPRGGDWLMDEIQDLRTSGVEVLVSLLTPPEVDELDLREEKACCASQGIDFHSFPIPDWHVPPFAEPTFTFLAQLHTEVAAGKHLALHCRQGRGRSALMAAGILVLAGLTPAKALEQLGLARGHSVPETDEQRAWLFAFAQKQTAQEQS